METKKVRFEGFQSDAHGGAFPLFTEKIETPSHYIGRKVLAVTVSYGTTLSGRSLFEQGYSIPSFLYLQRDVTKGDILELSKRPEINLSSKDRISN